MKTLNRLKIFMIGFIAIVSISTASAQCTASFNAVDNGNGNYTFTSTSIGGQSLWWTIDNSYSGGSNSLSNTFLNGTYVVCLAIEDSAAGCFDQSCQTIIVTSGQNPIPCNVNAGFTYVDNGNGNFSFNSITVGANYEYWNFGDGNTSTISSPNHTFAANGTYVVVLTASDSLVANGCSDFHATTIVVTGVSSSANCQAGFTMYPDSLTGNVIVINSSTGSSLTYFWDFGDGNTSIQQYPNYTYSTAGPFNLCLTVSDSNSFCTSTYCDSIGSNGYVLKQTGFTINVQAPVVTGIETQMKTITDINLYPNPVKENLTIELGLNETSTVELFVTDMLGNTVSVIANQEMNSGSNQLRWPTNNVPNGIYLLNIKTANSLEVKKLIVNK